MLTHGKDTCFLMKALFYGVCVVFVGKMFVGGLFKDLECELANLAISMDFFIQLLAEITQNLENDQNDEKATILLAQIISVLRTHVHNELNFRCES